MKKANKKKPVADKSTPIKYQKDEKGNPVVRVQPFPGDENVEASELFKQRLKEVLGIQDEELANITLRMASAYFMDYHGGVDKENLILQSLNNCKPRDLIETRLIIQETILFSELLKTAANLGSCDNVYMAETYQNMLAKITRIHNETVEALSRYRRGGSQTITVFHQNVDNRSVVNHFSGGGDVVENQGESSCSKKYVGHDANSIIIDHAACQQCPTDVAASTGENVPVRKRKKGKDE